MVWSHFLAKMVVGEVEARQRTVRKEAEVHRNRSAPLRQDEIAGEVERRKGMVPLHLGRFSIGPFYVLRGSTLPQDV